MGLEATAGSLPQVDVAWPLVSDWGTKSETGRELRTLVYSAFQSERGGVPRAKVGF